jgi:hypothetical protein
MAGPLSLKVDMSALNAKIKTYQKTLKSTITSEWEIIGREMAADVLSRTPSKDTEYEYLMTGASSAASLIPRAGDRSDDADPAFKGGAVRDRIRFMRSPGMWLEDLVVKEGVSFVSNPKALTIHLGIVKGLEDMSQFSWQNHSKDLGVKLNTSGYGVWSFFEYGTSQQVRTRALSAKGYKLAPDYYTRVATMYKNYPPFRMYEGFNRATFVAAVSARISTIKF